MTLDYLLTLQNGRTEIWDGAAFNKWAKSNNERIGLNFQTRLEQLRRYTGLKVTDWEMFDQ